MKLLVFGLILICCNAWSMKTSDKFDGIMENFLKKLKDIMKTGNSSLGIPVLDPFIADQLTFNLNEETINLNANLSKVNVNGLSEFDIINADFKLSTPIIVSIHLSWPLIIASTNYAIKGKVDVFEIFGNGEMKFSAEHFAFNANMSFLMEGGLSGHLKVQDLNLKLSLKKLDFEATGLFDDDELSAILSAMISDVAPELIGDEAIGDQISSIVRNKCNDLLSNVTVLEILKMIGIL